MVATQGIHPHTAVRHPMSTSSPLRRIQRILADSLIREVPAWGWRLRALGCECRNFLHRIGSIRQSPIYREGLEIGSEYHSIPWEDFRPCTQTRGCSADIEWLYKVRPWITLVDAEIFLEGWKRGAASPRCTICSESGCGQEGSVTFGSLPSGAESERLNRS